MCKFAHGHDLFHFSNYSHEYERESSFSYIINWVVMLFRDTSVLQDECVPCSPGHYCDTPGLTVPKGECWEGFYCSQGALLPNSLIRDHRGGPCPTGHSDLPCVG